MSMAAIHYMESKRTCGDFLRGCGKFRLEHWISGAEKDDSGFPFFKVIDAISESLNFIVQCIETLQVRLSAAMSVCIPINGQIWKALLIVLTC